MNIYLVSQNINTYYDTYDSMVVAAETEQDARLMHPCEGWDDDENYRGSWISKNEINQISVQLLGVTIGIDAPQIILASYNEG